MCALIHMHTDTHAHRHTLPLTSAQQALSFEVGILNCKQLYQNKTGGVGVGGAGEEQRERSKPRNSPS